jgi:hypothetical protein
MKSIELWHENGNSLLACPKQGCFEGGFEIQGKQKSKKKGKKHTNLLSCLCLVVSENTISLSFA